MLRPLAIVLLFSTLGITTAHAEDEVSPTFSLGLFFEFGDEAGTSGGIDLFAGVAYYPSLDKDAKDRALFASAGVQLRTGFIPLLTGPNQVSPQLRAGVAWVDAPNAESDGLHLFGGPSPKVKLYAIAGYRFASAFGLDNTKHLRKDERAFRLGLGFAVPILPAALDFPMPNTAEFLVDVNHDGKVDRIGFDVGLGF